MRRSSSGSSPSRMEIPDDGSQTLAPATDDDDEFAPLSTEEASSDAGSKGETGHSTVLQTAAMLTGEVMGTGVLSLPYACVALGWVLGIGASVLFAAAAAYAGVLLSRVRNGFFPQAASYADLAGATMGDGARRLTRVIVLGSWSLLLPYYMMAVVSSLRVAFADEVALCYWQWAIGVMVALLPFLQIRSLHHISHFAAASTAAMVAAIVVTLAVLVSSRPGGGGGGGGAPTTTLWPREASVLGLYSSFAEFIFAYQGHSLFLEFMREMRAPHRFPRALAAANVAMCAVYTATAAVGYGTRGDAIAPFLPSSLPPGRGRLAVSLLLAFHIAVTYMIVALPLNREVHRLVFPRTADGAGAATAAHWLLLTVGQLLFGYVVANAVPFFADFQAFLGALMGAPFVFGFPALFYLRASALHGQRVPLGDRVACAVFLAVCLPLFTVLGAVSAARDVARDWGELGGPFSCELHGF